MGTKGEGELRREGVDESKTLKDNVVLGLAGGNEVEGEKDTVSGRNLWEDSEGNSGDCGS